LQFVADRAAEQAIRATSEARELAFQAQARNPAQLVSEDQFGGVQQTVPLVLMPSNVAQPVDEVIRWNRCGPSVLLDPAATAETLIGEVTFRQSGYVVWMRGGTYTATPAALSKFRIRVEKVSSGNRSITTNGSSPDLVEAPSLWGNDGSQLLPIMQEVNVNDKWTVFGRCSARAGDAASIAVFGAFGFKYAIPG
jgi:hypothetical protein